MKKIISLILVCMLLVTLASTVAFAAKSPTVEAALVPPVMSAYFRVCNSEGKLVRYLSSEEISCKPIKDLRDYAKVPNLLYVFEFSSTYELQEGEYIEFPIYFNAIRDFEMKAIVDETQTELEITKMIEDYWMLNITEYGVIIITIIDE